MPSAVVDPPRSDLSVERPPSDEHSKSGERAEAARPDDGITVAAPSEHPHTLFYGSLVGPDGAPLRGLWSAGVSLTDANGRRRYCDAKSEGTFSFYALPIGKYWVTATADGYSKVEDRIELSLDHPQIQRDLVLRPATVLRIRVDTPDGQNLFDQLKDLKPGRHPVLVPVATATAPGPWFKEVVGSLNNHFGIGQFWQYGPRVEKLPSGCLGILILDREPPAFVSLLNYHKVLQTREVKPGDEEVRFVLSTDELLASSANIKLRVVDAETQSPLPEARAMLWGGTYMDAGKKADEDGSITFEGREPGEFDLHVLAKEHEEYKKHFLADAGTLTDLGTIPLEREIQVTVHVLDESGNPVSAKFAMGAIDEATGKPTIERQRFYGSTGDGVLKLEGLGRHEYVIRTSNLDAVNDQEGTAAKLVSGNVRLDLRAGADSRGLEVRLRPATSVTIVVQGASADGRSFRVIDEQGLDLISSRFYGNEPRPLSLPQGAYRVALLDAEDRIAKESALSVGSSPVTVTISP